MIEISLKDFLQTGSIKSLSKGITRDKVWELLGNPSDWDTELGNEEDAKIWKYNAIQIWFSEHILTYTIY